MQARMPHIAAGWWLALQSPFVSVAAAGAPRCTAGSAGHVPSKTGLQKLALKRLANGQGPPGCDFSYLEAIPCVAELGSQLVVEGGSDQEDEAE